LRTAVLPVRPPKLRARKCCTPAKIFGFIARRIVIFASDDVGLSDVESNVAEMRPVLAAATNRLRNAERKTILFIDEIHHFNKAQQDILLPEVETGNLRLIGATTYNPFFCVNSALVSRSQIFQLGLSGSNNLNN
jgi:replication-associated recombination protein RarA